MSPTFPSDDFAYWQHEMRQPLHAIAQLCQLLQQSQLTTTQSDWVEQISQLSEHMAALLGKSIDQPFSIAALGKQLETIFSEPAKSRFIELRVEYTEQLPNYWKGRRSDLMQLLVNLVDNAIKYSHANGQVTLSFDQHSDKGHLQIRVEDNGTGMSKTTQDQLHLPYKQKMLKAKGQGIGWAIIHQKLQALQAASRIESEPNKGTTITIQLPFLPTEQVVDTLPDTHALANRRLLVVEDQDLHRTALVQLLQQQRIDAIGAKNVQEAIQILQRKEVNCVLTDIHLSDQSGFDLVNAIRYELGLQIPVIAMSADAVITFQQQESAALFQTYLQKPFRIDTLVRQLTSYTNLIAMNDLSATTRHINLGYLMLMADGDIPMQKLMLSMLLDEIPSELRKINEAFEQKDWYLLRRLSHKMKTTLSFVGNDALILSNHQLVEHLKGGQANEEIATSLARLNEWVPVILEELRAVRESMVALDTDEE